MRRFSNIALITILLLVGAITAGAQEGTIDKMTIELSHPGEPASLEVSLVHGGVKVMGYSGEEVIIAARTGSRKVDRSRDRSRERSSGLKRIPVHSSSLSVEEYDNEIVIETDSWAHAVDLEIKVPVNTSLNLSCINNGDIEVKNIVGDLEVSNINGSVTLLAIDGSVVASCQNEDLVVAFTGINPDLDMSFSAFNGDVDISFPASLKTKVKIKTTMGDIFTDFDLTEIQNPERVMHKPKRNSDGRYQVKVDRAFWGAIGDSEQVMEFSSFNGDIYIRKN